jgi:hypothetical protein
MSRRIALPGADELFRSTGDSSRPAPAPEPALRAVQPDPAPSRADRPAERDSRVLDARLAPVPPAVEDRGTGPAVEEEGLEQASAAVRTVARRRARAVAERQPSGRERHDEKITVYVSADELMDLEHARLALRGDFGLSVDRGRVVREALAVVLADLEAKGESSILVRRLRGH